MNFEKEIFDVELADIIPNQFRPMEEYSDKDLDALAEQLKAGRKDPIIVRKNWDEFELISGDKFFLAAKRAKLKTIPAYIRNVDDKEAGKVTLLDNLKNNRLSVIDTANAYKTLMKIDNITAQQLARNLGVTETAVVLKLSFLELIPAAQVALRDKIITEKQAKDLILIGDEKKQKALLSKIIKNATVATSLKELNKEAEKSIIKKQEETEPKQEENIEDLSDSEEEEKDEFPTFNEEDYHNTFGFGAMGMQKKPLSYDSYSRIETDEDGNLIQEDIPYEEETILEPTKEPSLEAEVREEVKVEGERYRERIIVEALAGESDVEEYLFFDSNEKTIDVETIGEGISADQMSAEAKFKEIYNKEKQPEPKSDIFNRLRIDKTKEQTDFTDEPEEETPSVEPQSGPATIKKIEEIDDYEEDEDEIEDIPPVETIEEKTPEGPEASSNEIYDLRFAISHIKKAVADTEKFGFDIEVEEFDFEKIYQVVIKIDKDN